MRFFALFLLMSCTAPAIAQNTVSECTTEAMLPYLKKNIQNFIQEKMLEKEVAILRDTITFYDESYEKGGSYHLSVKVTSLRGSDIALIKHYKPLKDEVIKFFNDPEVDLHIASPEIITGTRDNEGIPINYFCKMGVFQDYIYWAYLVNRSHDNYTIAADEMSKLTVRVPIAE